MLSPHQQRQDRASGRSESRGAPLGVRSGGAGLAASPVIDGTVIVASENFEDLVCLRADNGNIEEACLRYLRAYRVYRGPPSYKPSLRSTHDLIRSQGAQVEALGRSNQGGVLVNVHVQRTSPDVFLLLEHDPIVYTHSRNALLGYGRGMAKGYTQA